MDDEGYVRCIIAADNIPDAHLDACRTDNDQDGAIVLHGDFDRMAGFQA